MLTRCKQRQRKAARRGIPLLHARRNIEFIHHSFDVNPNRSSPPMGRFPRNPDVFAARLAAVTTGATISLL